jgi:hypothetical protein
MKKAATPAPSSFSLQPSAFVSNLPDEEGKEK